MKTKLVYVLTCSKNDHYIEQALMSMWSALYWNPHSHIVLITDDITNLSITSERSLILNYVTERIVVPFEQNKSMLFRSRWIKTNVRNLIEGDYLFIDCDTIIQKSLEEIDSFTFSIGAVPESLLDVNEFCDSLYEYTKQRTYEIGVDLDEERVYFNSGVMYVKDVEETHQLYRLWHTFWKEGVQNGLSIDQPALSKANREIGRIIHRLKEEFNCMLWTRTPIAERAIILHISSYRNPSLIFHPKVLEYVKSNGMSSSWLTDSILRPCSTYFPFDFQIYHSSLSQRIGWIKQNSQFLRGYGDTIDPSFEDLIIASRFRKIIVWLLRKKFSFIALSLWMLWKRIHLFCKNNSITDNVCRR